jgi:hypothetical protein
LDVQDIPEHPGETSLVPRLDGSARYKTVKRKLPDSAALALEALNYALDEAGAIPPVSNHIPANTKCITIDQWKDYAGRLAGTDIKDNSSSERRSFDRGKQRLKREKLIGIWDTYVWRAA